MEQVNGVVRRRRGTAALAILGSVMTKECCCFPIPPTAAFTVPPRAQIQPHQGLMRRSLQHNSFTNSIAPATRPRGQSGNYLMLSAMGHDEDHQEDDNKAKNHPPDASEEEPLTPSNNNKRSSRHLGGRSKSTKRGKEKPPKKRTVPGLIWVAVALFFLSKFFSPSPSNVVYYSSSVYETRNYDAATGKVITNRQENFKSNIPDLVKRQALLDKSEKQAAPSSPSVFTFRQDHPLAMGLADDLDDFDVAIEKEMNMMFNDFWN